MKIIAQFYCYLLYVFFIVSLNKYRRCHQVTFLYLTSNLPLSTRESVSLVVLDPLSLVLLILLVLTQLPKPLNGPIDGIEIKLVGEGHEAGAQVLLDLVDARRPYNLTLFNEEWDFPGPRSLSLLIHSICASAKPNFFPGFNILLQSSRPYFYSYIISCSTLPSSSPTSHSPYSPI